MSEDSKMADRMTEVRGSDLVGDVSLPKISLLKETYAGSDNGDECRTESGSNAEYKEDFSKLRFSPGIVASLTPRESSPYQSDVSSSDLSEEMDRLSFAASLGALAEVQDRVAGAQRRQDGETNLPKIASEPLQESLLPDAMFQKGVGGLVLDLESNQPEVQKKAVADLRLLAKYSVENRVIIADSGAIKPLVALLNSVDPDIQENAVTALLNLSINDNNKSVIAAAGAIDQLVSVLKTGNDCAMENAAATLCSLAVVDDYNEIIGTAGAIPPLVRLLRNGSPRGKKDATKALFKLSILHENKARVVSAGAVKPLVELMADPGSGMVDKAVAVLANLSTILEGRVSIGDNGGISALVEVVESGSPRGKENAAATLLQLCTNSVKHRGLILQEGALPHLVALSKSGTTRGKEKASAILRQFREHRGPGLRPRPVRYPPGSH